MTKKQRSMRRGMVDSANDLRSEDINCFWAKDLFMEAFPDVPEDCNSVLVAEAEDKILSVMNAFAAIHEVTCIPVTDHFRDEYSGDVDAIISPDEARKCVAGVPPHCGKATGFYVPQPGELMDCLTEAWTNQQRDCLVGSKESKLQKVACLKVQTGWKSPDKLIRKGLAITDDRG